MLKLVSSLFVVMIVAGCSAAPVVQKGVTIEEPDGKVVTKSDYSLYLEKASEQRPIFEMTCPPSGCIITGLKVNNPNQVQYAAPQVEKTWGMAFTEGMFSLAGDALRIGVPWFAGMRVLEKAFDKANASVTTTTSTVNAPTTTTLTTSNTTNTSNTTTSSATTNTTSNTMTNTNSNTNSNGR